MTKTCATCRWWRARINHNVPSAILANHSCWQMKSEHFGHVLMEWHPACNHWEGRE